ncbi:MAG: arginine repressor [Prevotella sp.]|nr:arginine repressor [Prevotella sp.]
MKKKAKRFDLLRTLISTQDLSNQEEVLRALKKRGITVTQATLSRDLKQLKVAKAATIDGKYVYVLPDETMYRRISTPRGADGGEDRFALEAVVYSGNIGVIKTLPGYAGGLAYSIDRANIPQILGTIAGDDTIMIILIDGANREEVRRALHAIKL